MKKLLLIVFLSLIYAGMSYADLKKEYGRGEITPEAYMLDMQYKKQEDIINFRKEKDFSTNEHIVMTVTPLTIKLKNKVIGANSAQVVSGIVEKAFGPDCGYMSTVYIQKNMGAYSLSVEFPNYATYAKVPVVENFYGLARTKKGEIGNLFHDSLSPWVCVDYKMGNFVGIIIYPDGTVKPLKEKDCFLKVGRHPELK